MILRHRNWFVKASMSRHKEKWRPFTTKARQINLEAVSLSHIFCRENRLNERDYIRCQWLWLWNLQSQAQGTDGKMNAQNEMYHHHDCDQCDYKATQKSSLKSHTASQHLGIEYNCNKCDYKATTKSSLKYHTASQH